MYFAYLLTELQTNKKREGSLTDLVTYRHTYTHTHNSRGVRRRTNNKNDNEKNEEGIVGRSSAQHIFTSVKHKKTTNGQRLKQSGGA